MAYWLVKTEPTDGGLLAFQAAGPARLVWDGVRNYQARNFLRAMDLKDEVLLYHASCAEIGVVAQLKVARKPYPDPLQFDPESAYFRCLIEAMPTALDRRRPSAGARFPESGSLDDVKTDACV